MPRLYDDPTATHDWFDTNAPGLLHTLGAGDRADDRGDDGPPPAAGVPAAPPATPPATGPGDTGYPARGGQGDRYSAVAQMYRTALGREGTAAEINAWANGPYDIGKIQQEIYGSAEAKAYGQRQTERGNSGSTAKPTAADAIARLKAARASGDQAAAKQAFNDYYTSQGVQPEQWDEYWRDKIMGADGDYYINEKLPQSEALGGGKGGGEDLFAPFTEQFTYDDFKAPTAVNEQNDPGYAARLRMIQDSRERRAAAEGNYFSGTTQADLDKQASDYGSQEYANLFGRELTKYSTNRSNAYDQYAQRRQNFYQNQDSPFAKLFALSQLDSSNTNYMNGLNLQYAQLFGNTTQGGARDVTNNTTGAANANAAGLIGSGNAYAGLFGNLAQMPWLYAASRGRGAGRN